MTVRAQVHALKIENVSTKYIHYSGILHRAASFGLT